MNNQELIVKIGEATAMTKKEVEKVMSAMIEIVEETVSNGEKVTIGGLGNFTKVETKGRTGVINFGEKKGQIYTTEDSFKPKFSAGKEFETRVKK